MTITPAIKGRITKAINSLPTINPRLRRHAVFQFFLKRMPREQAKHATRKYLAGF
jgi:hypothetical protein